MAKIPGLAAELDIVVGRAVRAALPAEDRTTRWRARGSPLARRVDMSGTVTAAQAGLPTPTAFFVFAVPVLQSGRLWSVRKVVVQATGAGPFAGALANVTAALFVTGQSGMGLANLSLDTPNIDCAQVSFTLPTTQFFGAHQITVRSSDDLVLGIQGSGVTSGLQVFGYAQALEIDDDAAYLLDL